jgi:negative regulator of sigma-B (phosphoserine phosphatase)
VEFGTAQRPANGESECGDAYSLLPGPSTTLVALADGLGHGPRAAEAARAFCAEAGRLVDEPLEAILASADRALAGTRGAAAVLARLDGAGWFEFAGVGNIGARALSRLTVHPVSVAGTLGRHGPRRPRCERFRVERGDLLVLFTDGISGRFDLDTFRGQPPSRVARALIESHGKGHDDATCIAIRWPAAEGGPS